MNTFSGNDIRLIFTPSKLLMRVLKRAAKLTHATSGSIMLLNPNTGSLDTEAVIGSSPKTLAFSLRPTQGICGWVASHGKPLRIDDVHKERRYIEIDRSVRSELAVPMEIGGQVIGILNMSSSQVAAFTEEHERQLVKWSEEAVSWLRVAWEVGRLRSGSMQLESLVNIGQAIVSQEEKRAVLRRVTREACRLMKTHLSSIMLLSENGQELILQAWHGASTAYVKKPNLSIADSLVGVVIHHQKPLTVLNVQEHEHYQHTEIARKEGLVSLLSVPLTFEDKPLGVLSVYTKQLHRFSNDEIALLSAMAGLSSVMIARASLNERAVHVEENLKQTERLSALGWLAAEVAHEIRNPLTVMRMLFHSMMQNIILDENTRRDAEVIETKMLHMNRIVEQTLTFARSAEPELLPVNIQSMMDDITLLIRHKLAAQGIDIRLNLTKDLPPVKGDRIQLEQAFLNLVMNACKAMPRGGMLTIGARMKEGLVSLYLKDTGQGISKRRQEQLFKPFISYDGGTGLGLALVQKTIEQHKGTIRIKSRMGSGSTFEIILPPMETPSPPAA